MVSSNTAPAPRWTTPAGSAYNIYLDILKQHHTLIAGASGSGKSTVLEALIYTALYKSPERVQFVLIDPKQVDLQDWETLPHTIAYADTGPRIAQTINACAVLMDRRIHRMKAQHQKKSTEADIYIIVDEFADLMTVQKRETVPALCRIAQLGRAANMHLILATQRPTRDIITGQIKVNIDSRLALRCPTRQDSRNIIDAPGAETLPKWGQGYYLTPDTLRPQLTQLPRIDPGEIAARVQFWTAQAPV